MYQQLQCIALRTVRHSDRHNILTAYSRQNGRIALLLPASATPRAKAMRALAMPMGRFDCMADIRAGREIFNISDMRRRGGLPPDSPAKSSVCMFAADVAASLLREQQPDTRLFDFLDTWSENLAQASASATANSHIAFLISMMHFMGIEPDWSTYSPGKIFDMTGGIFRTSIPSHRHFLDSQQASQAFALRRLNLRNARLFGMSRTDRNAILDALLKYYRIHFPSLGTVNSLTVLRTLFSY